MELKVMTFNIHHGRGIDGQLDLERIARLIQDSEADMIGLNEVDKHFSKRSHFQDQIGVLADYLNMECAYAPALTLKSSRTDLPRQYGNALLSRYPIVDSKVHYFNFLKGVVEGRSLLQATIDVNKRKIITYVTHLSLNPYLHSKQTEAVIQLIKEENIPQIIMGDWNMKPHSKGWKELTQYVTDSWSYVHQDRSGYTYPSRKPHSRIDYIFASHDFHISSAKVVDQNIQASDHLPLKAIVTV